MSLREKKLPIKSFFLLMELGCIRISSPKNRRYYKLHRRSSNTFNSHILTHGSTTRAHDALLTFRLYLLFCESR